MNRILSIGRRSGWLLALAALAMGTVPATAHAQMQTVDPDSAIDGDLAQASPQGELPAVSGDPYAAPPAKSDPYPVDPADPHMEPVATTTAAPTAAPSTAATVDSHATYQEDDLIGAAEGVFGKGAKGLADVIQDILKKQGQPNAYITGREAGGAIAIGVRYGSGTMHHKVEGTQTVYWTGPSIGFDAGANAASTFVLVYNLWDSEELYERFPAGEGQAYLVGGFNVSYMRKGDVVLIPVRVGAGLRLGVNAGYMKFSKKQRWLPF